MTLVWNEEYVFGVGSGAVCEVAQTGCGSRQFFARLDRDRSGCDPCRVRVAAQFNHQLNVAVVFRGDVQGAFD